MFIMRGFLLLTRYGISLITRYLFKLGKTDKVEISSTSEDIIELQDVRMSPIPSLRKSNYSSTVGAIGTETLDFAKFPPSFRIARNYGSHRNNLRFRGTRGNIFRISFNTIVKHEYKLQALLNLVCYML